MDSALGDVGKVIRALTGDLGERIVLLLLEQRTEMSDEEIAQSLGARINDVRKVLYDLVRYGFVTYKRITRRESYWHVYKWFTNEELIARALLQRKRLALKKLIDRLNYEKNNVFYECPVDGSRYSFDEAFENYFRCPRCGADLVEVNNEHVVKALENLIERLSRELERDEKAISSRSV